MGTCCLARTHFRLLSTPSSTLAPVRTPPVSDVLVQSGDRLWMSPHSGGSTRLSGLSALVLARLPSVTSSPSPSACLMSSSMPPREAPTATPSRRRTSSSVLPSPTDKLGLNLPCDQCIRQGFRLLLKGNGEYIL